MSFRFEVFEVGYVFAPHSLSLSFFSEVELEISFSAYFIRYTCWFNSFSIKQKIQKLNRYRHLLGKNLDVFQQNSTFFRQIVMIILKIDGTLKSFLGMQLFNYCLNELFP